MSETALWVNVYGTGNPETREFRVCVRDETGTVCVTALIVPLALVGRLIDDLEDWREVAP